MNTTKTQKQTLTLNQAAARNNDVIAKLALSACSYNALYDPIKKIFTITTVNSADAMKVLFPESEVKLDRHERRYTELIIEYI